MNEAVKQCLGRLVEGQQSFYYKDAEQFYLKTKMKRSLTLLTLLACCAHSLAAATSDDSEEDEAGIQVFNEAPEQKVTLINLTNATVIAQLTNSNASTVVDVNNHRIVGGRQISISEAPWQGAVIQSNVFVCGCSLINPSWVLTAAHCVYGNASRRHAVRLGSDDFKSGGQLRIIDRVTYHGSYNSKTAANDIALLRTSRPFKLNQNVQAVRLPSSDNEPNSYLVSGWGTLNDRSTRPTRYLRGVNLYPVNRKSCENSYRGLSPITDKQLCAHASKQDSCQGDSGGALTSQGVQYGIVSFGNGCGRADYPGVYTNVFKYRTWIKAVTKSLSPNNNYIS